MTNMKKFFCLILFFSLFTAFAENPSDENEVLHFSAEVKDSSVFLSWVTTPKSPTLILYRSLNPFIDFSSLAEAVLLSTFSGAEKTFIDYPQANTNYYYALVFEKDIVSGGQINFVPSKNVLPAPVRITELTEEIDLVERDLSLPILQNSEAPQKPQMRFSKETEIKLQELKTRFNKYSSYVKSLDGDTENKDKSFFRFPEETEIARNVTSLSLKRILDNYAVNKAWEELETELKNFLRLSLNDSINARAEFYLAESLYFQDKFEDALLKFLQIEDIFEKETKEWINIILEKLVEKSL